MVSVYLANSVGNESITRSKGSDCLLKAVLANKAEGSSGWIRPWFATLHATTKACINRNIIPPTEVRGKKTPTRPDRRREMNGCWREDSACIAACTVFVEPWCFWSLALHTFRDGPCKHTECDVQGWLPTRNTASLLYLPSVSVLLTSMLILHGDVTNLEHRSRSDVQIHFLRTGRRHTGKAYHDVHLGLIGVSSRG